MLLIFYEFFMVNVNFYLKDIKEMRQLQSCRSA